MNHEGIDFGAMKRIVKARITQLPKRLGDPLPEVWDHPLRWNREDALRLLSRRDYVFGVRFRWPH